jgi:hypothetical protein
MTSIPRDSNESTPRAIETVYAGCRFRSRLEARWAVFFDALEIKWQYEPEGFEDDGFSPPVRYLPDFFLPTSETWVEVKGSDAALRDDSERLESFLDFDCPMPFFTNSADDNDFWGRVCHGLLILGDIPYVSKQTWGPVFHPIIQHHEGLLWHYAIFDNPHPLVFSGNLNVTLMTYCGVPSWAKEWSTEPTLTNTGFANQKVVDAYTAARSARFEHGERG